MGLFSNLTGRRDSPAVSEALARADQAEASLEVIVEESLANAELAMDDVGWQRLTNQANNEFSRAGLQRNAEAARAFAVIHPLIKRGLGVRQAYVWGQGCTITARSAGKDGEQDVNAVVQAFMDDQGNRAAFTGDQAQEELERALGTDGNVFLACFTSPLTGFVQVRSIRFDEIQDVISNPDDADDPWFYQRSWIETTVSTDTATTSSAQRTAYYPAITHRPLQRVKSLNGSPVMWDAPVYHVSVNRLDGWKFGVGDAYAALTDARLYRDFLIDWAVLVKSLSQFAWKTTSKGSKADRMRKAIGRRPTGQAPDANPNSVGATVNLGEDTNLEAIPKSGATIDSESGRPLAAMIGAALDVSVTTLLADPGQTGARAVAETLNFPMRLAMQQRQSLWAEAYRAILAYVIRSTVRAPQGPLQGTFLRDRFTGRETLTLALDTDQTVTVEFPSLEDSVPIEKVIEAIVKADSTEVVPKVEILRLLLAGLQVDNADQIIEDHTDDQGRLISPRTTAGQAAVDAHRRGEDPAEFA